MGSAVPSRVSLLISILRLNLVLTYGIPPEFRGGVHLFICNRHLAVWLLLGKAFEVYAVVFLPPENGQNFACLGNFFRGTKMKYCGP